MTNLAAWDSGKKYLCSKTHKRIPIRKTIIDVKNFLGNTAFLTSAIYNKGDIAQIFINKGTDLKAKVTITIDSLKNFVSDSSFESGDIWKNTKWILEDTKSSLQIEKNKANADREQRKSVVSPVNGIINKLYFYTEGGIVKPGDKLAEITPIEDNLTIEAKIKSSDRAFIWEGQDVSIEITAYDFSRYGLLNGKLISISPDSFEDKNGSIYYTALIYKRFFYNFYFSLFFAFSYI